MLPGCDMILTGALGQQGAGCERYFDPVIVSRCQAFEHRHCNDSWGAKLGANDPSYQATPGHFPPLRLRENGTSGHVQHYRARFEIDS